MKRERNGMAGHYGSLMIVTLSIRTFYTTATLMLAFGSPGEKLNSLSERQRLQLWELMSPSLLLFASEMSNMLFPALSFMAVGGIMFLMTNMQVCHSHHSRFVWETQALFAVL